MQPPLRLLFRLLAAGAAILAAGPALRADRVAAGPRAAEVDLARYARVLHVDAGRGDDVKGDGSAEHPVATLTRALEQSGGATAERRVAILVAQGRYTQPTFVLRAHVDLYGGFAGFSAPRDVFAHRTVIDGEDDHRIAFGADDARVDGFFFVHGRVRGKGAALLCDGTSPVIANCVFTENRTLIPKGWAPALLHETAHDGGAIMCLNGAAPRIEHNFFYHNTTECGRGAAIAADRRSAPRIVANVLAGNRAGLDDPMRSSDGGAISIFDHSGGEIADNIVVANQALNRNDAGGIFVALWSAPRVAGNVIVGNFGGDDAGGLFIGGQEHRYDAPLDAYPKAEDYTVVVADNVLVGNANSSGNSGATRITMESRVRLTGNLVAKNEGGLYLQRSEVVAENNTVWQDWRFVEDKPSLGPSRFTGNVLKGEARPVEVRATFEHNMLGAPPEGSNNLPVRDIYEDDGVSGAVQEIRFDPRTFTTVLTVGAALPGGTDYAGRPVLIGDNPRSGQWQVVQRAAGGEIVLWGRLEATTNPPRQFSILRTFTPKPDAPRGLGVHAR